MVTTSQQLWDTIERLHLHPSSEAKRIKARWFRPDRAEADDPDTFGKWLVSNGYLTKFALEKIRNGEGNRLRIGSYLLLEQRPGGGYFGADTLGRRVVIDLVDPGLASNPEIVSAFESAAERLMSVQHSYVNRVLDFGRGEGSPYLVREYDEGVTLAEVLKRRGRLESDQAAKLFGQAFGALQALHEKQVPGGELGPDELLLATSTRGGRTVKVLNAGLPQSLFRGGRPEEVLQRLRPLARAEDDLFRLGQTFYLALTGQVAEARLAGGQSPRPIRELVPEVPDLLAGAAEQLLDGDVSARPRAAARVAKTLRVYLASGEQTRTTKAEEEITAPVEAPAREEEPEETPAPRTTKGKLAELWADIGPKERDWFFLAGGAASVVVLVLLLMLFTGIHFINVVCLMTGAAISFFAEKFLKQREAEAELE